jgi:hypothetical protein
MRIIEKISGFKFQLLILMIVFSISLLFLYQKNDYYVLTELRLYGNFQETCKYQFSWDTGEGFNNYETIDIKIDSGVKYHSIYLPYLTIYSLKLIPWDSLSKGVIYKLELLSELDTNEIQFTPNLNGEILVKNMGLKNIRFEPKLFGIQIFISLIITWLFFEIINLRRRLNKPDWKSVVRCIFVDKKRTRFWIFFGISFTVFISWLLGQWPGAMTTDSLLQWLQTKSLDFQDNHPYMSSLYYVFLSQIWDNPAIVPIFQIIIMSALGSFIFWWLNNKGIKTYLIVIFFILWVTSIPVGLFNIILWKDIPFSILAVFWAFLCFYLFYNKKNGRVSILSTKSVIILSITLIITGFIRHNGILYLILIPILIFVFNLFERKKFYVFIISVFALFLIFKFFIPVILEVKPIKPFFSSLSWKVNPLASLYHNRLHQSEKSYYSYDYERDIRYLSKLINIDTMKKYYTPEHGVVLLLKANSHIKDMDIDSINSIYYKLMILNFPSFLADRAYLFGAMIFSYGCTIYVNDLSNYKFVKNEILNYNWKGGLTLYKYKYSPIINQLNAFQNDIYIKSASHPFRLPVWNYIFSLVLLFVVLIFYKYLPCSSLSSFVILFQVPFIILTAASPDFRYLYFVFLFSFFIIPISILEKQSLNKT